MPRVTALRVVRGGRVAVELDGAPWRQFQEDVVVRAALLVGTDLDRPVLRALARERRRSQALVVAARALRHRDLSERKLADRLERAGIRAGETREAIETLVRAGFVDDDRVAQTRAQALARRGLGDEAIRFSLERDGLDPERVEAAISELQPEGERAKLLVARRGRTAATARYLVRRGFGEDAIDVAVGSSAGAPEGRVAEPDERAYDS